MSYLIEKVEALYTWTRRIGSIMEKKECPCELWRQELSTD